MHKAMIEIFHMLRQSLISTKSGSILTKICLGTAENTRVGRETGNTQLIYLGLNYLGLLNIFH